MIKIDLNQMNVGEEERYPSDWKKVILMVSPEGEMHAIGGDRDPGQGDQPYVGLERIKSTHISKSIPKTEVNYPDTAALGDHPQIIRIRDCLETVQAVLLLEYHNSNWLQSISPKTTNEELRSLVEVALKDLPSSARNSFT